MVVTPRYGLTKCSHSLSKHCLIQIKILSPWKDRPGEVSSSILRTYFWISEYLDAILTLLSFYPKQNCAHAVKDYGAVVTVTPLTILSLETASIFPKISQLSKKSLKVSLTRLYVLGKYWVIQSLCLYLTLVE